MNRNDWKNILELPIMILSIPVLLMIILAIFGYHWQNILAVTALVGCIPVLFIIPILLMLYMPDKDKAKKVSLIGVLIAMILSFIIFKIIFPEIF